MKGGNVDEKEKKILTLLLPEESVKHSVSTYCYSSWYCTLCSVHCRSYFVFVAAFSDEKTIVQNGFSFIPKKWSLDGINAVLRYGKQLATSYGVTIFITVVGTLVGLLIMAIVCLLN